MNRRWIVFASVMTGTLVLGMVLLGCGKGSSPMAPSYGGGGGGVGGVAADTPFDSGTLTAPAGFDHMFPTAGQVGYHCNFHVASGMVGTVVIAAGGDSSATVTASGMTFTPSSVTIRPGGTVHWSITGGTHTVTSN